MIIEASTLSVVSHQSRGWVGAPSAASFVWIQMKKLLLGFLFVFAASGNALASEYTVEKISNAPPSGLSEVIRAALQEGGLRVLLDGEPYCEIWFRKSLPAGSGRGGLSRSYPEIPETALLGAIRVIGDMRDNRDNRFRKGLYTIRHGLQPQDGNHVGASDYIDFALLLSAEKDATVEGDFSDSKGMINQSLEDGDAGHPVVFGLTPPRSSEQPSIEENAFDRWVLEAKIGDQVIAIEIIGYYEH